jgi:hypothetical protein
MPSITATDTFSVNGGPPVLGELRIDQPVEWVRSERATKPDPTWELVDEAGHFHAFDSDGKLPTLIGTRVPMPCDGSCGGVCGGEGYTVVRYTCRACEQEIEPRWIPDMAARTTGVAVPLLKEWTLALQGGRDLAALPRDQVSVRGGDCFGFGQVTDRHMTSDGMNEPTVEVTISGAGPWAKRLPMTAPSPVE